MAEPAVTAADLAEAAAGLLARRVTPELQRQMLAASACSQQLWRDAADAGWFSLAVPAAAGGLGLPARRLGPVAALLGRHLVPGPFLEQLVLPGLIALGQPAWRHLTAATAGQVTLAFADAQAFAGPGTGRWADNGAGREPLAAGPDGTLRGSVAMVVTGERTGHVVAPATAGGQPALVLLDTACPGVALTPLRSSDPAQRVARLALDAVPARDYLVLARGDAAARQLAELRDTWRLLLAYRLAGVCRWALEATVAYVTARHQFGRPVGAFQAVKHIAADMARLTITTENLCEATAADLDPGVEPATAAMLAMTAKAHASAAARQVCESAIQLHGGIGFTAEVLAGDYYKHALALKHWYGGPLLAEDIGAALLQAAPAGAS